MPAARRLPLAERRSGNEAQLIAAQTAAERALAVSRSAVTLAGQLEALRRAEAAVAEISTLTGAQ